MPARAAAGLAALALLAACANEPIPGADEARPGSPSPPGNEPGGRSPLDPRAAAQCAFDDIGAFAPPAWEAPRPAANACTEAEIDGYLADCLDPATALPVRCAQNVANHAACAACLSPAGPGPLVEHPGGVRVNVAGCIALAQDDPRPQGCGAREAAAAACAVEACARCEDDGDGGGDACEREARQGACAAWEMRTCSELSVAAVCVAGADAADRFRRAARVFCEG